MGLRRIAPRLAVACAMLVCLVAPATVYGQVNNNNGGNQNGGNQNGGNNQNNNGGGSLPAGVIVDPEGVLRTETYSDASGQLIRQRVAAAKAMLDGKVQISSKLRKVSLNRLEKAIEAHAARDGRPTEEMKALAGITRLQYVFYYPETKDIVIAGPAEGWVTDISGRTVGMESGRPVLELQDLIVALRAYPPGKDNGPTIGCSIDPTPEGLARMQRFLQQVGASATPDQTAYIVEGLQTSLGLQKVSVLGIAPDTHFAQVMVEADYRMKLIGIGMERPPVKLASYVDLAKPSQISRNAMERWYFMPDYECVRVSEDKLAMELVGYGVKLVGDTEMVEANGGRKVSGRRNKASEMFTHGFTSKYPDLAARSPVYAQLRNLIDISVAAAFIQQQDYYGQADWEMATLGDEDKYPVQTYQAPLTVPTAVTARWKGNRLTTPVGGGVHIEAGEALLETNLLPDEEDAVRQAHQEIDLKGLSTDQWWWD